MRLVVALALPMLAALTVVGTYLGKEIVIFAGLLALSVGGFLFVRPVVGLAIMTTAYLLAAYPTALQSLGLLSVNNLLGVCFVVLLMARVLETRDLSFLVRPQVLLLVLIGILFLFATLHAAALYPTLEMSRATGRTGMKIIDRTQEMTDNFTTRLFYLIFILAFVRNRVDTQALFFTMVLALFTAVPSALINWAEGDLSRGFRTAASVTAGSNPNRLAMICLIEIACFWFWARARPSKTRMLVATAAIIASALVWASTGSRSGALGALVMLVLMQTSGRRMRVPVPALAAGIGIVLVGLVTIAPPLAVQRMFNFFPETRGEVGASSIELRESAIDSAMAIIRDHKLLGVGLGNFREVARQIYADKFFRPPHNSVLWAQAEGGIGVLLCYLLLFGLTWRDLRHTYARCAVDPELAALVTALRTVLGLFLFFSLFADLWLNPLAYLLIGLTAALRMQVDVATEQARRAGAAQAAAVRRAA
ncbi:MAG TPA: O-antigen ligase family protein [Candidatus Limnocylindria bacterium]|nr:O-antigen ligase family protein [Candidatus Limnocylindria bacterium]